MPPAAEADSLNHWAAREVPESPILSALGPENRILLAPWGC